MKLKILFFVCLLLESCCINRVDCNPPFYDAMKIQICCVDIKEILETKMYIFEKNTNFKNKKDSVNFNFNNMHKNAGSSGLWVIPFDFVSNYYEIYNYDLLAIVGGKKYEITDIQYSTKTAKCGCERITLTSFRRNGLKFNQDIISIHD